MNSPAIDTEIIEPSNAIAKALKICESAFARSTFTKMDTETRNKYKRTIEAFDVHWATVKEAKVEFRYADSCFQFGVLEQSITPILRGTTVIGQCLKFRINPDL